MTDTPGFSLVDVCLICSCLIWGFNSTAVKYSLGEFSPLAFNAVRFSLASVTILLIALYVEKDLRVERRDLLRIVGIGFLGNTLYQVLFINGINLSTAGNTTLVLAMMPVSIAILGRLFAYEHIPLVGWAGIAVSFTGVLIVTLSGQQSIDLFSTTLKGDLLTLAGVFCFSSYTLLCKPLLKRYSPLKLTAIAMASGSLFLVIYSLPAVTRQDWLSASPLAWAGLVYSFSLSLVFAYIVWNWGVSKLGSTRTAVYQNLTTISGVLASWLVLGEPWTPMKFFGALLTLGGLAAVRAADIIRLRAAKRRHAA